MDQAIFHLINERWTHPALDLFMAAISDIEIWKPFLIVLGLCVLIFGGFKARAFIVCLGLALSIPFLIGGGAVDRRHLPTGDAQIDGELAAMMDLIVQQEPKDIEAP